MTTAAQLQAEAERQSREGLRPGPLKTHCVECSKPFTYGAEIDGANVYSMAGARDTQIVGMCESCFDSMCGEAEE